MTVVLIERSSAVHRDNYGVLGVRKMWHALDREGIDIGREHATRLMRLAGVSGTGTGGSPITTRKANVPDLRPDVVEREFKAQGLKQAVGGRHYLRAHEERLCVWRICHRRLLPVDRRMGIIGLDAHFRHYRCKHSTKRPKSARETTGLIHHSDHGLECVSVVYNERLTQHGITASTGTVGD